MHVLIDYKAKCALTGINFESFSNQQILKLSVKEITNPQALDRLLNSVQNGLYDLALGPLDKNDICMTCNLDYFKCPGHFGHINLVLPVYNPIYFKELIKLLRSSCLTCHQLCTSNLEKAYFLGQMALIREGLIEKLVLVDELYVKILNNTESKLLNRISFRAEFDELVKRIIHDEEAKNEGSIKTEQPECVRNVLRAKLECLKKFMDQKLKPKKTCPACTTPLRQLRSEHNAKLFYAKGVSARVLKKTKNQLNIKFNNNGEGNKNGLSKELIEESSEDDSGTEEVVDEMNKLDIQLENDTSENESNKKEKFKSDSNSLGLDSSQIDVTDNISGQTYLTPIETRKHLQQLIENEKDVISCMLGRKNNSIENGDETDLFFFDSLAIPPSKYRPISQFKDQKFENPQTAQLSKLLQQNIILQDILTEIINSTSKPLPATTVVDMIEEASSLAKKQKPSIQEKLQTAWLQLQGMVNVVYDSEMEKLEKEKPVGLKQLLEKKEGLFRKHMMGKRVNFAGRSVISPDTYLDTNEIGIPEVFAKKLTYPQPVNSVNFWEMKQLVLNGPDVYPGACIVEYGNGNTLRLKGKDYESRLAIAKQLLTPESSIDSSLDIKIVHRHLKNGDVLLFNRQPTLHRPSVMAHKARVLRNEKTLRMHYSNCKSYNADFDGDEMNAHLPQNEVARAEALELLLSPQHYLVPKDGTPLGGLIHDHVVSGVCLTMRGRFFDRADYQSLVYNSFSSLNREIKLLPPCVLKPQVLWSGKQVVSTLLLNLLPHEKGVLNLESKSKIAEKTWYRDCDKREPNWKMSIKGQDAQYNSKYLNESYVLIRSGLLLSGVLDKAHYGSSSFSLVHCCYELYGGHIAGQLLSCLGRLFTAFLQLRGFTLGVEDIILRAEMAKPMSKIVKKVKKCGYEILAQVFKGKNLENKQEFLESYQRTHNNPDESFMKEIDLAYKGSVDKFQNSLTNVCFPNGLIKTFPKNNLQLMIQSGAKGSSVNSMQMSCLLGQQELEGRRPRLMPNGNTLPSFLPYDPTPNSGGFICNSFMTGLTPQEYFFHCMAGREGLVDTAVKTSRSGYLQRCLVKHLEGIVVNYDMTVRDSDNSVIQFQYGEDSLAVEKTPFIEPKQFPFLIDNYPIITSDGVELATIRKICHHDYIDKKIAKTREWHQEQKNVECGDKEARSGPFFNFSKLMSSNEVVQAMPFNERVQYIREKWSELTKDEKKIYKKGKFKERLPITCAHNPDRYLGAISEKLQDCIDDYMSKYGGQGCKLEANKFQELIYLKALKSCITPGDCVGVIAAQSIGEPSTQMTLNTFHFAGRGDMNVTLGIPRLREILMVASSNIKTPSMQVPVFDEKIVEGERFKEHLTRTLLWDCVHSVDIEQTLKLENQRGKKRLWMTKVRLDLLPQDEMRQRTNTNVKLWEVLYYVENKFVKNLCISINKKYNQIHSSSLLHASKVRDTNTKNFSNINDGGDDADESDNDGIDRDDAYDVIESGEASDLLNKIDDERGYEGEEEEKRQLDERSSEDGSGDETDENLDDGEEELEQDVKLAKIRAEEERLREETAKKRGKTVDESRVNRVLKVSDMIDDYTYDANNMQWLEITFKMDATKPRLDLYSIIQKEARISYIAKVQGIKRCFLNQSTLPEDKGCYKLITEGINVNEMIKNSDIVDVSKLYMNDIHCMSANFGIEAAVKVLINEMKGVFNAYGINVDYRHLSLIADYMTYEGIYKPFNRIGIKANASPLQKMSFETCLQFFKDAVLTGQYENFDSPSSRIVAGRTVKAGTGCFEILTKLI